MPNVQISLLAICLSQMVAAAESMPGIDYYLKQAFNTPRVEDRRALSHIGIEGDQVTNGFLVSAVLESYPGHRADLRRGDIILSVDGEPFHPVGSFNSEEADQTFSKLLNVQRGQQKLEISVSPVSENLYDSYRTATLNSVLEFNAGNKVIGYVHLWGLSRNTGDLLAFQQTIQALDHCDGIILDLRDSYGFSDDRHISTFLPQSLADEAYRKPVAILINQHTRNGGEVLVSTLDKLERIISIGEATSGEASDLDEAGHVPEEQLLFPPSEVRRDDPQFERAIEILLGVI